MADWHVEHLHDNLRVSLKVEKVLYDSQTEHQHLVLFENATFGRVLSLDTVLQTTERDEFIYHEMLTHVPILAHGGVRRVLIIGGGDGGMLEEILKHQDVEKVTMVEIDEGVVQFSRQYLPSICGSAFDDPRLDLVIADGAAFVANTDERYDVVIVDSTDPVGPGEALFTRRFYENCRRSLAAGGVLVTQNGVPFLQGRELADTMAVFREIFADHTAYIATVPTYIGGPMAFGWGSDDAGIRATPLATIEKRFAQAQLRTDYYTPAVHKAAFALPPYIARIAGL